MPRGLGIAGLQPAEQARRRLPHAFARGRYDCFAADRDPAGDGRFGRQVARRVTRQVHCRLPNHLAADERPRDQQDHGDRRTCDRRGMIERLQERNRARVGVPPAIEFRGSVAR